MVHILNSLASCDPFCTDHPHSQANGDQGDFEEIYAACPDCFQDTLYNKILTSKIFGKPLTLWGVQYIDPEVPFIAHPIE